MNAQHAEMSPRRIARIAGGLYLLNIIAGFFAIGYVPAVLLSRDIAATIQNIQMNEMLYRLGLAAHLIPILSNIPIAVIFYDLFKGVNRRASLLVVFFTLVATAIEGANLANQYVPLILLSGRYANAFTPEQVQALAYIPLVLQTTGYNIQQVIYACYGIAMGYLVFKSTFMPRPIGVLLVIGSVCYLIFSFTSFLAPDLASRMFPYIQLPSLFGEGSLCLWLLIVGVNVSSWEKQTGNGLVSAPLLSR